MEVHRKDRAGLLKRLAHDRQGDTRRYPGLGLGLCIVRDTVLAMEGEVDVESVVGEGTVVSVLLPAATGTVTEDRGGGGMPIFAYGAESKTVR